jgi:hypothetical protein
VNTWHTMFGVAIWEVSYKGVATHDPIIAQMGQFNLARFCKFFAPV